MAGGSQRNHKFTQIITNFLFLASNLGRGAKACEFVLKASPISQWKAFRFQAHRQTNGRYYWYPTPLR
jgi:hypothetical protein